jgi:adenosylcobinamide-phosphate synthase
MELGSGVGLIVLLGAMLIEIVIGYPPRLYRRIGHPVEWMGMLIAWLEKTLNRNRWAFSVRRACGLVALIVLVGVSAGIADVMQSVLSHHPIGLGLLAIIASSLLAARSLMSHVNNVALALEQEGLPGGQRMVALIVGRDPDSLDEAGVARAAIESLAENFSDGVVAPAIWFACFGLPGMAAYKAINTADSMIGHHTPRYEAFGWAAARCDDLVNLPASRLTGLLVATAALWIPSASATEALRAICRDARNHRSPNAGWPEAAMAGALGLKLAGPRRYQGVLVTDAPMGRGRAEATIADIHRALSLYRIGIAIGLVLIALTMAILFSAQA